MNAHRLRRRRNALLRSGHGARNTAAAFLSTPAHASRSATRTGNGLPPHSAARGNLLLVGVIIAARKTSSGKPLILFSIGDRMTKIARWCRFEDKQCCLHRGGPPVREPPPPKKQCPPKEWSWSKEHNCCVPHNPGPPPPKCHKDWRWSPSSFCCEGGSHK